ncbi:hypothetical protein [Erythrobacter sp. HKB08]|uniref:hypothetical protein n=1 Tax=Erythrobacter sp. HKB08 TaxID=2502843 RepID=UPI0010088CA6|nr:hypothetical protein [Erythrobacter sp. HKB08]
MRDNLKRAGLSILAGTSLALAACGGAGETAEGDDPGMPEITTYDADVEPDTIAIPDWFPDTIYLPVDFRPLGKMEIGTRNYLLRGTTAIDPAQLMETYRTKLAEAGYEVTPVERMAEPDREVVFKGNGLESGRVSYSEIDGRDQLQIDFAKE